LEAALEGLDASIRELDEEIRARAEASPLYGRLLEMDGVGPATAAALAWVLGSRGFQTADRAVAFAGLDVRVSQSGTFRGKGRLTKRGPGMLRRLLFLAARSLCRSEPWKPLFERHRAKGMSHTAAVAVARKLLRLAWGLAAHP
jgi:transposase